MKHAITFAVAIAIALSAHGQSHQIHQADQPKTTHDAPKPESSAPEPTVFVEAGTVHEERLAEWAIGRFEIAGLALPDVGIHFHEDDDGCLGYHGLHTTQPSGSRIDICARGFVVQVRTLLHELAHAWASREFPIERRDGFLALRGLDVWHDDVTRWNQQGTEHAAEIIAWGVAEHARLPGRIADHDPDSVAVAYEYLTGQKPISITISDDAPRRDPPGGSQP